MIRVEKNNCLQKQCIPSLPSVSRLEKAMLTHATFKSSASVLDANVRTGGMAEYLLSRTDCQVCGISDRMEEIRKIRAKLSNGDFAYAAIGDIPWQDASFDVVLLHPALGGLAALEEQLKECSRVIRIGGQLVLGLKTVPAFLIRAGSILELPSMDGDGIIGVDDAENALKSFGFIHITRHPVAFGGCVLIGQRREDEQKNRLE